MHDTRTMSGWSGLRLLAVALAACTLAACAPEGSSGGRIDSYRSTKADRESDRASIPALLEFSDRTAQQVVQTIMDADEIRNSKTKLVLELGLISNQTTTTPSGDFQQIQARVRGKLSESDLIRSRFLLVEGRGRMNAELDRVNGGGGNRDLLQNGSGGGGTAMYDPKITYVLTGDFFEMDRGDRRQYYFVFHLVNLATRVDVIPDAHYDLGQKTEHDD